MSPAPASAAARPHIPAAIWTLGLVSLFTDLGSELVHGLLPVYLAGTLGVSMLAIGLIEGGAEGLALAVKVYSGWLSDAVGRRKPLVLIGYGIAAVAKFGFPLATGAGGVLAARLLDRFGKGIRGAPRDALVADLAPPEIRGASFGLRQSLDTVGAFAGPLLAIGLMLLLAGDIRSVLWIAVLPGLAAVALIVWAVREPARITPAAAPRSPLTRAGIAALGRGCWMVVALGAAISLARFSEAFLLLRVSQLGMAATWVPLVLVVMNAVYMLVAWPAGHWSDAIDRRWLLGLGLLALLGAHLVLALADSTAFALAGVALWGLHLGLSQGVLGALLADAAPAPLRGTAFGLLSLAQGLAILLASVGAGALWQGFGAAVPFWVAMGPTVLALLMLARSSGWSRGSGGGTDRVRAGNKT